MGGQLPFARLIDAVDRWAGAAGRTDVFAQVGDTEAVPSHIESARFLDPAAFRQRFDAATVVISHAGMGTILSALEAGKPILVVPRRASLGEHRNEHQLATVRHLQGRPGITVAMDEAELSARLERIDELRELQAAERLRPSASPELLSALRSFVTAD